ncbi:hypothetical protein P9126_20915 [Bacillus glycinifermentans]|uniref:hypothetical protein n=1 Tax=Bacillus glycinifermentans TaxID=1664069 RepID=UPI002DC05456|nr:hypothetical protein [Bacillus glycinifermentans]MEC3609416.1 hypothetical protein [Bacillus glycinifermentans]
MPKFFDRLDKICNKATGTIKYASASELIYQRTDGALKEWYEMGAVHPKRGTGRGF